MGFSHSKLDSLRHLDSHLYYCVPPLEVVSVYDLLCAASRVIELCLRSFIRCWRARPFAINAEIFLSLVLSVSKSEPNQGG